MFRLLFKITFIFLLDLFSIISFSYPQTKVNVEGVIIKFKDEISWCRKWDVLQNFPHLQIRDRQDDSKLPGVSLALFRDSFNDRSETALKEIIKNIEKSDAVLFANPLVSDGKGHFAASLGEFYVKLFSSTDFSKLEAMAKETGTKILKEYKYMRNVLILSADKNSRGNAKEMAEYFSRTKLFRYASPNMLFSIDACTVNDPLYNRQWAIENTGSLQQYSGTPDADMDVDSAWTITAGDSTIKVAVLDSGVDTLHADLAGNLLPGFDATGNNSNGYPNTTYSEDGHGTACAGIIAAIANNSLGVAGVAYNCKVIPVRVFYYTNYGGTIVPYSTNQWGADGINWAWQVGGADVLSNSWGIPDSLMALLGIDTAFSNDALNSAIANGRNGKGLPALFSAGNSPDTFVLWPASLPSTIAVAATTMCDELKTMSDCSPENFWGSNQGTGLDISAPGVKIATTDITGAKGFSGGDFYLSFNGTSAACPNAAAVMALILSVNKNTTGTKAREIISTTCDKTGGYSYSANSAYGSWSMELGYGRVNAHQAVKAATVGVKENSGNKNFPGDFYIFRDESGKYFLRYAAAATGNTSFEIFDAMGKKTGAWEKVLQSKGIYQTDISTFIHAAGVYFFRLTSGTESAYGKFIALPNK